MDTATTGSVIFRAGNVLAIVVSITILIVVEGERPWRLLGYFTVWGALWFMLVNAASALWIVCDALDVNPMAACCSCLRSLSIRRPRIGSRSRHGFLLSLFGQRRVEALVTKDDVLLDAIGTQEVSYRRIANADHEQDGEAPAGIVFKNIQGWSHGRGTTVLEIASMTMASTCFAVAIMYWSLVLYSYRTIYTISEMSDASRTYTNTILRFVATHINHTYVALACIVDYAIFDHKVPSSVVKSFALAVLTFVAYCTVVLSIVIAAATSESPDAAWLPYPFLRQLLFFPSSSRTSVSDSDSDSASLSGGILVIVGTLGMLLFAAISLTTLYILDIIRTQRCRSQTL